MTVNSGVIDTELVLADEKVVDMEDKFVLLDPDQSQFMTIMNKLPSVAATREKVNWLEDQYFPNLDILAASAASADTSIQVTNPSYFRVNDLIRVSDSGEMLQVTAVSSTTAAVNLAVTRSIGSVGAASSQTGVDLLIVGNVSAQGADYGTLKAMQRVLGFNYTQIQRHPFGFTNTDAAIATYGPGDPANELGKKAVEHKRAWENTAFWGARDFTAIANGSEGFAGGLREFISTNVHSSINGINLATMNTYLAEAYAHGSQNKVLFAAPLVAQVFSALLANNWVRAQPEDRVYGAKVSAWIDGAYGASTPVIVKREWSQFQKTANFYGTWAFLVDLDNVRRRPLRGTQLLRNRQGNGVDSVIHEYLTEQTFVVAQEKTHSILKGILATTAN